MSGTVKVTAKDIMGALLGSTGLFRSGIKFPRNFQIARIPSREVGIQLPLRRILAVTDLCPRSR